MTWEEYNHPPASMIDRERGLEICVTGGDLVGENAWEEMQKNREFRGSSTYFIRGENGFFIPALIHEYYTNPSNIDASSVKAVIKHFGMSDKVNHLFPIQERTPFTILSTLSKFQEYFDLISEVYFEHKRFIRSKYAPDFKNNLVSISYQCPKTKQEFIKMNPYFEE